MGPTMVNEPPSPGRHRILVVDDDPAVAAVIARWLRRDGIECDTATGADQARVMFAVEDYAVVFADVHMPGGSGLDLARSLKHDDPAVQIVVVTGSTTIETAVEALRLEAHDYLAKPFEPADLLATARRAIARRDVLVRRRHHQSRLEQRVRDHDGHIERMYLSSVHALVTALEAKDASTRGHSDRVASYARALAERLPGLDPRAVEMGARLHDIGKIGIPGAVLAKDGPLDMDDWRHVRRHPTTGTDILTPLLDDPTILGIVRHHHEKWDGSGYPDGLAGADIPLAARVVAVADAFDAMTNSRPYRGAMPPVNAVAEIEKDAGRHFCPEVAAIARAALLTPAALAS